MLLNAWNVGWIARNVSRGLLSSTLPLMLPSPVHAFQPGPEVYPGAPPLALLTPLSTSRNTTPPLSEYSRGLRYPTGSPRLAFSSATSPA